jgi:hypothetical protein
MPIALVRQAFRPGFVDKHRLRVPLRPRWQKQNMPPVRKRAASRETDYFRPVTPSMVAPPTNDRIARVKNSVLKFWGVASHHANAGPMSTGAVFAKLISPRSRPRRRGLGSNCMTKPICKVRKTVQPIE